MKSSWTPDQANQVLTCFAVVLDGSRGGRFVLPALQFQVLKLQLDLGKVLIDVDWRLPCRVAGGVFFGPVVLV